MQQINLYTQEFRPRKDPLAFKNMLVVLSVIWFVGLAYSGYLIWDVLKDEQRMAGLEVDNASLQQEVDILEAKLEARARDVQLQSDNKILKARLRNTQHLLDIIDEGINDEEDRGVFGDILMSLARHRVEPVWLFQIEIYNFGQGIALRGVTEEPEMIPEYLKALGSDAVMTGRSFNIFQVEKPEGGPESLRIFRIDTQIPADAPEQGTSTSGSVSSRILDMAGGLSG
ncbi:hypothetical protein [Hahella ganghwensis]|uniref:hypothetical protein n=1 Tax=Hahella ganghwensis TaxID=286420 RepID=UPI0012FBE58D|nr:hypothetical protein [Hahella ganghwensis]